MAEKYIDFQIHIRDWVKEVAAYPVEASLGDGSFFFGLLSLDEQRLLQAEADAAEYGRLLYQALLAGPIGLAYERARGIAAQQSEGRLRVRLWIDSRASALHSLKWERLYQIHQDGLIPLSTTPQTPFARYTGLGIAEPQPVSERPVRLLFAIANPVNLGADYNLAPIDVRREVEVVHQALGDLRRQNQIQVTVLPGQSQLPADLQQKLDAGGYHIEAGATSLTNLLRLLPGFHVLHLLGHGAFRKRRGQGGAVTSLYLEGENGAVEQVEDSALADGLRTLGAPPHLIFLSACETGRADPAYPFVGLAPRLVQAGVPAVVAMQEAIKMESARQLTHDFYGRVMQHGVVDRALNEARGLLYDNKDSSWAVPVLFMRLRTGQLFSADPVQAALEAMARHREFAFFDPAGGQYISLPIEVAHLTGDLDYTNLDRFGQETTGRIDVLNAIEAAFPGKDLPAESPEPVEAGLADASAPAGLPKLVVLAGGFGSNKSTQLRRIVWKTVQDGLADRSARRLPVYVGLQNYRPARLALGNPIETLALENLRLFWPDLTASNLGELPSAPTLRLLFDGIEDLSELDRELALRCIIDLITQHPQHEYLLGSGPFSLSWSRLVEQVDLHLLLIQPLNHTKIRHFLNNLDTVQALRWTTAVERRQLGQRLLNQLHQSQLLDLAATPRFMFELLQRAARDDYPKSRTAVLHRMVRDILNDIAPGRTLRAFATETVHALALEMHMSGRTVFPVSETFRIMSAARGNRSLDPETLYNEFLEHGLLSQVGDDELHFAYAPIQAYCSAWAIMRRADRLHLIHNVITTLAASPKLRLWEETLVCLSGLLARNNDVETLQSLLRAIVYGLDALRGEQLFLAARCLLECEQQHEWLTELRQYVVSALRWRLSAQNEPKLAYRALAAELLSRLAEPEVAVDLARLVYEKVRRNLSDREDYEFSSVRMAAAIALKRMPPEEIRQTLQSIHPDLVGLFGEWQRNHVEALIQRFVQADDTGLQAITALALGDLVAQAMMGQTPRPEQLHPGLDCLAHAFENPETNLAVRWAVADALGMIDPNVIAEVVIKPALQALDKRGDGCEYLEQDKSLAYLIGLVRPQEPLARDFLVNTCLRSSTDMRLWLSAVDSLGRLANADDRELLEAIATNTFDDKALDQCLAHMSDCYHVRRKAIEVLADLGSLDTIATLGNSSVDRDPELDRTFYESAQAIYWRLQQSTYEV